MKQFSTNSQTGDNKSSSNNNQGKSFLTAPVGADRAEFTAALREVIRCHPADIKAPNHNDVIAFIHSWFAGFDHIERAKFFLAHFNDTDMSFNMDGQVLAHNHNHSKIGLPMRSHKFPGIIMIFLILPQPALLK